MIKDMEAIALPPGRGDGFFSTRMCEMYEVISGEWQWTIKSENHKKAAVEALGSIDFSKSVELGPVMSVRHQDDGHLDEKWFLVSDLLEEQNIMPTGKLRLV